MNKVRGGDECKINIENGLLLYHHPYSYYSQKVLMALHEKRIPFEQYVINLVKNEQYEQWFLDLNPRGEFPVLQISGNVIPSSNKIIGYLEDIFHHDESIPRLITIDQGPGYNWYKITQKVTYFRDQLDQIQSGIVTLGSFFHDDFVGRPKIPFIKPVRTAMKNAENNRIAFLTEQMEYNPRYRHVFQQKIKNSHKRHEIITSRDEFQQQLALINSVLDKVEDELASHAHPPPKHWLCCETFTVADISLTVLLERLNVLGLETHFWGKGRRPNVEMFYAVVQRRHSYRQSMPNLKTHLRLLSQGDQRYTIAIGVIAAAGVFVFGGCILIRKIMQ